MSWGQNEVGLFALVLAEIRALDRPVAVGELARHVDLAPARVQLALAYLRERGRITRTPTPPYRYFVPHVVGALPAIKVAPVPFLAVSLGVVCEPRRIAA